MVAMALSSYKVFVFYGYKFRLPNPVYPPRKHLSTEVRNIEEVNQQVLGN